MNPSTLGGSINYTLDATLPYIVAGPARRRPGAAREHRRRDRLCHEPALHPARHDDQVRQGLGARRAQPGRSLNVGSRSYINGFDAEQRLQPQFAQLRRGRSERSAGRVHFDLRRRGVHAVRAGPRCVQQAQHDDPRARHVGQRRDHDRCRRRHQRRHVRVRRRGAQHPATSRSTRSRSWRSSPVWTSRRSRCRRTGTPTTARTPTSRTTTSTTTSTRRCRSSPTGSWPAIRSRPCSRAIPFFRGNVMAGQWHRWPGGRDRPSLLPRPQRELRLHRPERSDHPRRRLRQSDGQRRVGRDRPDLRPQGHGRPRR